METICTFDSEKECATALSLVPSNARKFNRKNFVILYGLNDGRPDCHLIEDPFGSIEVYHGPVDSDLLTYEQAAVKAAELNMQLPGDLTGKVVPGTVKGYIFVEREVYAFKTNDDVDLVLAIDTARQYYSVLYYWEFYQRWAHNDPDAVGRKLFGSLPPVTEELEEICKVKLHIVYLL